MSSGDASGIVQCNLESSTASGCSQLRMGTDSQDVERRYVLSIRPRYDAVIAAGESHAHF